MDRYDGIKEDMDPDAFGVNVDLTGEVGEVAFRSKQVGKSQICNYGPFY